MSVGLRAARSRSWRLSTRGVPLAVHSGAAELHPSFCAARRWRNVRLSLPNLPGMADVGAQRRRLADPDARRDYRRQSDDQGLAAARRIDLAIRCAVSISYLSHASPSDARTESMGMACALRSDVHQLRGHHPRDQCQQFRAVAPFFGGPPALRRRTERSKEV